MINSYEINLSTVALVPYERNKTQVIEDNKTLFVKDTPTNIIDNSCKFFGSSYLGRHEGTKNIIGISYKAPIIIEESREIIFFPTNSPRLDNCYWISLNKIEKYFSYESKTKILFKNGSELVIDISYGSFDNQILRSTLLESVLRKRKIC
ncbi:MAG: competence protein ComK [Bacilli bacterium]